MFSLPALLPHAQRRRADAFFERLLTADAIAESAVAGRGEPPALAGGGGCSPRASRGAVRLFLTQARGLTAHELGRIETLSSEFRDEDDDNDAAADADADEDGTTAPPQPQRQCLRKSQFRLAFVLASVALEAKRFPSSANSGAGIHVLFDLNLSLAQNAARGAFPDSLREALLEGGGDAPSPTDSAADSASEKSPASTFPQLGRRTNNVAPGGDFSATSLPPALPGGTPIAAPLGRTSVVDIEVDSRTSGAPEATAAAWSSSAPIDPRPTLHRRSPSLVGLIQRRKQAEIEESLARMANASQRATSLQRERSSRVDGPTIVISTPERFNLPPPPPIPQNSGPAATPIAPSSFPLPAEPPLSHRGAIPTVVLPQEQEARRRLRHHGREPVFAKLPLSKDAESPEHEVSSVPVNLGHTGRTRAATLTEGLPARGNYDVDLTYLLALQDSARSEGQVSLGPRPPSAADIPSGASSGFEQCGESRKESVKALLECYSLLEKGRASESLEKARYAFHVLQPHRHLFAKEVQICSEYVQLTSLLVEIAAIDLVIRDMSIPHLSEQYQELSGFAAVFARFAAELTDVKPNHRVVCVRMALKRNFEISNFGISARFIRLLLPLNPMDARTLDAKLQICATNNFSDTNLPEYTCPSCSRKVSCAPKVCAVCHADIRVDVILVRARRVRHELQIGSGKPPLPSLPSHVQQHQRRPSRVDERVAATLQSSQPIDFSSALDLFPTIASDDDDDLPSETDASVSEVESTPLNEAAADRRSKRDETAFEFLESERSYVGSLDILVNMYLKPLQDAVQDTTVKALLISENQLKAIFANIESIHAYNSQYLAKLEHRMSKYSVDNPSSQVLADIILDFVPFLKTYTAYVNGAGLAFVTVTELEKSSPEFAKFCQENKAKCHGLDLASLLIQPVQRIPRYVLLLRDLIKRTDASHPDLDGLKRAAHEMSQVASYINERKRDSESKQLVYAIQQRVVGLKAPLMQPHRWFLRRGTIRELQTLFGRRSAVRYLLLFNDILLVCKAVTQRNSADSAALVVGDDKNTVYRVKAEISLSCVYIGEVGEVAGLRLSGQAIRQCFQLTLTNRTSHSQHLIPNEAPPAGDIKGRFVFQADSEAQAREWVTAIGTATKRLGANLAHREELLDIHPEPETKLTEYEWSLLLTNASVLKVKEGDVLMRQYEKGADPSEWAFGAGRLFRVESGQVTARKMLKNVVLIEDKLGPGSIFGLSAFIGRHKPNRTVVVSSKSATLSVIDADFVIRLLRIEPTISAKFFKEIAVHFADLLKSVAATDISRRTKNVAYVYAPKEMSAAIEDRLVKFGRIFPVAVPSGANVKNTANPVIHHVFTCDYTRSLTYRGDLYIARSALCYSGYLFGLKKLKVIEYSTIQQIEKQAPNSDNTGIGSNLTLKLKSPKRHGSKTLRLTFNDLNDRDTAATSIENLVKLAEMDRRALRLAAPSKSPSATGSLPPLLRTAADTPGSEMVPSIMAQTVGAAAFSSMLGDDEDELTKDDWALIMRNAERLTFRGNEVVFREGSGHQRIFQVVSGTCRVVQDIDGKPTTFSVLGSGDIFGEQTFLLGGKAISSVIANSENPFADEKEDGHPDLELYCVDGRAMRMLFEVKPGLAGRFYRYLAIIIDKRVRQRLKLLASRP